MIQRLYVHNYRCLENFSLPVSGQKSLLLIGKNGSGKSTVRAALEIFQKIGRGLNRVGDLVKPKDIAHGRVEIPVRFEIEVDLNGAKYSYTIAFEFPHGFKEMRVLEEILLVNGIPLYERTRAKVSLAKTGPSQDITSEFNMDWHLVALPIVQERSHTDPLFLFKQWLSRMLILSPVPSLINGDSFEETLLPKVRVENLGDWFAGLIAYAPSAYGRLAAYLKDVMPDLKDIRNPVIGTEARSLIVNFQEGAGKLQLPFNDLSDGEKCFIICALVVSSNEAYGPLFCFWDEPENHIGISEVGQLVGVLRNLGEGAQFIATSHNPEAIRRFSDETTLFLDRRNHLEPTVLRSLTELEIHGDLVKALTRGDVGI